MKRRRLLSLIGGVLCLAMLATAILPNLFTFAAPALEVLNPWGEIQPQKNLPLAERPDTLDDGKIGLLYFDKFGGAEFTAAIKTQLQTNYTGVTFEETELDSQYAFAQSKDWYDDKSEEYDAVLISGANDGTTAYWAACHAREFEKRGVPVVIAVLSTYVPTLALAAEDYGITALRSVAIPIEGFTKAYKDIAAMIVPIAQSLSSGIESALTDPLTDDEMDPDPIKPADALENIAIPSGISFEKQLQYFNSYAMEQGFGDGLPLTLPTKTAVDRMLAATVRNPDEVLGKLRMRYGICTIEKIAINAVMAGAEPEYFPVIIAAMEALCDGIEDKSLYHAALTSSDNYMLMLVLSGPIAKDLDFATDRGYMTSGLRNNNTIGRAVMLSFRNIGHNTTPYVDTNRYGRHQDHTGLVFTENEAQFPPNWTSHGESMGFDKNQSSVTVVAIGRMGQDDNWINNEPFGYNISELLLAPGQQMLLNKQRNATTNNILRLANLPKEPKSSKDIMMYTLSPAHAALLLEKPENPGSDGKLYSTASHDFGQEIPAGSGIGAAQGVNKTKMGLNTKEEIRDWWTLNGVKNGTTGIGGTTSLTMANVANPDIPFAANKNIVQLLLVGENPTYALIYESKFLGADAYRTQLITGATKTNAGQDATAPSQPQNFKVLSDGADKVDLSWSAPARTNGSVTYEVSSDDGATWKKAGAETSYTFEDLNPDEEYSFVVRAVNGADNARVYDSDTFELLNRGSGRGAQARPIVEPDVPIDPGGPGGPGGTTPPPSGGGKQTDIGNGATVTTPAGQDPVKDEDGTITLPGGGTITVGGPGGATIIAPPGTTVTADGQIKAPAGSGGLKVSYGGFTFSVPESLTIILDEEAPLGFYISSSNPFLDVSESDWFYDAVMYAFNLGLMNGTASDMFSPNNPTTRAMIVTILYRLEGSPEVEGSSEFTDVPNGQWYTDAVIWGAKNDIVLGFPEGDFRPNSNITREQFATILHRYADYKEYDTSSGADADLSGYTDEDQIHDYAVDHMKWANAEGLITGRTATTLVPLGNATRAEAATIMMRFIEGLMK